jgi:hypothetical protein
MQRNVRLILEISLLIPSKQALSNDNAGISIGVATHPALWAIHQWSTWVYPSAGFAAS